MTPPRNVSALQRALRRIASSNEEAAHLQLMFAHEKIDLAESANRPNIDFRIAPVARNSKSCNFRIRRETIRGIFWYNVWQQKDQYHIVHHT